jgi:hypothetical protein
LAALLFLAGVGLGALVHMWMTGGDRPAPQDQAVASSRRSLGADAPMPVPSDIASGGKSYGTSALTPAPAPVQEVAAASSEPAAPMASRPESPAAAARPIPVSAPAPRPAPVREKAAAAPAATASALVARIGEKSVISEQDLTDFSGSASCYGPDAINSRNAGFMRMLESSITEEVLRRDAHTEITPEEYAKEVKRVDQGTRAPDILICIKKYFGWTPEGGWTESGLRRYERVFLRPHMGGGLHQFVMFDRKVQSEAYDRQDAMLAKGLKGEAFSDLAQSYKVDFTSRTYSYTEPQESSGTMHSPEMRWSPFEKQFIDENLKGLSPGQVKPKAIEIGRASCRERVS